MTTREVHQAVRILFDNYDYPIFNSFIFDWESDFFAISKSGYSVEVEVKVSKQDFKKDFTHKIDKHKIFEKHKQVALCLKQRWEEKHWDDTILMPDGTKHIPVSSYLHWIKPCEKLPNKFYYACPEGLIKPDEVPAYAGLIYTKPVYGTYIVKPAPFLHKNKKNFDKILLGKYYHRNTELYQLLCSFKRQNNLTEEQDKQLIKVINRMH